MRVFYFTVLLIVIAISITMGQAPHSFNYQAIIRDKAGAVVANKEINFRISITAEHQSGERVYSELHRTFTNQFGVINLQIGEGEPLQGIMKEISWGASDYYLRVEVDAEGGYNFEEISNARLLSVPYSLWSQSAGYAPEVQDLMKEGHVLTITHTDSPTEIDLSEYSQELSLDGRTLSISNGNSVELNSDIQDLSKSEHILTITGNADATEIDLSEYINTDEQTLSLDGRLNLKSRTYQNRLIY